MENIGSLITQYTDPALPGEEQDNAFSALLLLCDISSVTIADRNICTLPKLIQLMEPQLTSENVKVRNRATLLLSELLHHSDVYLSHGPTLSMLIKFYTSRLHDYPSVSPCLHGLISLFEKHIPSMLQSHVSVAASGSMSTLPAPLPLPVMSVYEALDMNLPSPVQGLAQSIRFKIFSLLLSICGCIQRHSVSREIFDIFSGFEEEQAGKVQMLLSILCNSVEGEKDPRCLLLTLRLVKDTLQLFPDSLVDPVGAARGKTSITSKTTDIASRLYGCVACYFPITFTPPPFVNAEDTVTPEQLVIALEDALCCHISLLEHTVPFLIDQLVEALDTSDASVSEQSNSISQALSALTRIVTRTMSGELDATAITILHDQLAIYHRALRDALYSLSTSLLLDNKEIVGRCDLLLGRLTEFAVLCDFRSLDFAAEGSDGKRQEPVTGGCCGGSGKKEGRCCKTNGGVDASSTISQQPLTLWLVFCCWVVDHAVYELNEQVDSLKSKHNAHLLMVILQHCNSYNSVYLPYAGCNTTNSYASEVLEAVLPVLLVQLSGFYSKYNRHIDKGTPPSSGIGESLALCENALTLLTGDGGDSSNGKAAEEGACCQSSNSGGDNGGCCQSSGTTGPKFLSVAAGSTVCKSISLMLLFSQHKPTNGGVTAARSAVANSDVVNRHCVVILSILYKCLRDRALWGEPRQSSSVVDTSFSPFLAETIFCASHLVFTLFTGLSLTDETTNADGNGGRLDGATAMRIVEAYVGSVMAMVGISVDEAVSGGNFEPEVTQPGTHVPEVAAAEEFISGMVNWPTVLQPAFDKMCLQPLLVAVHSSVASGQQNGDLKVLVACLGKIARLSATRAIVQACTDCLILPALECIHRSTADLDSRCYNSVYICLETASELLSLPFGSGSLTVFSELIVQLFLTNSEDGRQFRNLDALLVYSQLAPPTGCLDGGAVVCLIIRQLVSALSSKAATATVTDSSSIRHDTLLVHIWQSVCTSYAALTCSLATFVGLVEASLVNMIKNRPLVSASVGPNGETIFSMLLSVARTADVSNDAGGDVLWNRLCSCIFLLTNKSGGNSRDTTMLNAMLTTLHEYIVMDSWGYSLATGGEVEVKPSYASVERTVSFFLWIAKAVFMRNNVASNATDFSGTWQELYTRIIRKFIDCANSAAGEHTSSSAVETRWASVGVSMAAQIDILCWREGDSADTLNVNMVWQQKLWSVLVSPLLEELTATTAASTEYHKLLAVITFATCTPVDKMGKYQSAVFAQLIPCLLVGLGFTQRAPTVSALIDHGQQVIVRSVELLLTLLESLQTAVADTGAVGQHTTEQDSNKLRMALLTPHLNVLLPALLQVAQAEHTRRAKHRYYALRCLELLLSCTLAMTGEGGAPSNAQQNIALLFPHKSLVIKQLVRCLDDPKRTVRLLAVRVRNLWILSL